MKKRNIDVLSELISFSQKFQTDLMIAIHEGVEIANIKIITDEEQNKLDEAVKILKEASERVKSVIFNQ